MASLTTAWSPSSFRRRLAFHCRIMPAIIVRTTRARNLDRRVRVWAQEGPQNGNCNGVELRRTGDSWMSTNSAADSFAGWSGSDSAGTSGEYRRKQWLKEIVGTAAAGAIIFAGLTFAALSLSKRITSGPKQQMEPLTAQEEVSLAFESGSKSVQGKGNAYDSQGYKTGIDNESPSHQELNKSSSEDGSHGVGASALPSVKHTFNGVEAINDVSVQEDLQYKLATNDASIAPDTSPSSPKILECEVHNGSSSVTGSDANLDVGKFEVNLVDVKVGDSSVSVISDVLVPQEGFLGSTGEENSESLLDSSSSSVDHIPGEPLAVNVSVPEVDAVLEPHIPSKDEIKMVTSDFELEKPLEVSTEKIIKSQEVHNATSSVAELGSLIANEETANGEDEIKRGRELYDALNPRNSFSSSGIPAPSVVSAALQVVPGRVLVRAVVDQVQWQALAALQALKVIESDLQASDLCTRREYARWLVSASSTLSRSAVSKVYPAMYIENVTELAFDDITPKDADFSSIQGLAEAGLIASKLSRRDMLDSLTDDDQSPFFFSPESPVSRQDLVSWKMALEKRHLPEADRKVLHELSGFLDIDKIDPDAWPAVMADLYTGEQGITALAFGYTKLFQPNKPVTKAQAAIALATGEASDIVSEELARIEAESIAENAVAAHSALVAQVEEDINSSFEKELSMEREKISAAEKLMEETRKELERLRTERDREVTALMKEHTVVESEKEVLSRLRREVEEQLQSLMTNKVEISYEKEKIHELRKEAENENNEIARLRYELDVERRALSMARAWAEDEAKRARQHAKAVEEARDRWETHGIKVIANSDLQEVASTGVTTLDAGKRFSIEGTVSRSENLVNKLKAMAADIKGKSKDIIDTIIQRILLLISSLRERTSNICMQTGQLKNAAVLKVKQSGKELQESGVGFSLTVKEGAMRVAGDCRDGVEKLTQKFKMG